MGLCCCRREQEILTYDKFVDFSLSSEYLTQPNEAPISKMTVVQVARESKEK